MNCHIASQAFFVSIGIVCLLSGCILSKKVFSEKEKIFEESSSFNHWIKRNRWILIFLSLVFTGMCILMTSTHLAFSVHKETITNLFKGGNNDSLAIVLGLLGIAITLATAVVFSVSYNAVNEIRREKLKLNDNNNALRKQKSLLKLALLRLELLYSNDQEIKGYVLSGEGGKVRLFRESLQAHYAKRENLLLYIKDVNSRYSRSDHGPLLSLEREYLQAIKEHYQDFAKEYDEECQGIPKLIDNIMEELTS